MRVARKESVSDKKETIHQVTYLSTSARKERRRKGKEYVRKFRLKQKLRDETGEEEGINTSGYESVGSSVSNLIVLHAIFKTCSRP